MRKRKFWLPGEGALKRDAGAGIALGLVSIPDGLAAGILAGINPVAGLYGYLVGTVAGALTTSSALMSVQATGAMAVLIADVPEVSSPTTSEPALVTLAVLTGAVMLTLGVLKLGSLVRFVPNAVLTGFVSAVAVNIVLGQLGGLTGYVSEASNRLGRAFDTVIHVAAFDWPTFLVGLATIGLILILERSPLGPLGLVVAVIISSAAVAVIPLESVEQLRDIAEIPQSLPVPVVPSVALILPLLVPALSLAFVGLVQGAAISQSVPNPDGSYPDVSGDFRGQGIANVASGILQGMPVGGSMSATALVTSAGGRSRLVNLTAGAVMVLVILLLGNLAGFIAMPALAALLILVGVRTFKPALVKMVWQTGPTQAAVMTTTFVLTLLIPLQYAVLTGIGISAVLFVARQSNKIVVTRWIVAAGTDFPRETAPPKELPPHEIVVLRAYGSLFFASAAVFEQQLPDVTPGSHGSVVVLLLRGKEDLGSTFIQVFTRYADELHAVGGHLVLAGLGTRVLSQLSATGALDTIGRDNAFAATPKVGEAMTRALDHARKLLGEGTEKERR